MCWIWKGDDADHQNTVSRLQKRISAVPAAVPLIGQSRSQRPRSFWSATWIWTSGIIRLRQQGSCERFEPRSHIKRLSLIVRVNVVLNRTVVVDSDWRFDNLCGSHLHSQSELCHVSWWYYTLVIDLIGQLCRDVIGRLSVKQWCYWLWRLVISDWCVSIRLLSQLNSRLLLVKLSVLQLFSRS